MTTVHATRAECSIVRRVASNENYSERDKTRRYNNCINKALPRV